MTAKFSRSDPPRFLLFPCALPAHGVPFVRKNRVEHLVLVEPILDEGFSKRPLAASTQLFKCAAGTSIPPQDSRLHAVEAQTIERVIQQQMLRLRIGARTPRFTAHPTAHLGQAQVQRGSKAG